MTRWLVVCAALVQATAMVVDEGYFHRGRGLPRWERIGHPLDTTTVAACYAWLALAKPSAPAMSVYVALAIVSCLFVTKDEVVHGRLCAPGEHWLHAVLFVCHPVVLAAFGWAWLDGWLTAIHIQLGLTLAFGAYQIAYWNLARAPT